MGIFLFCESLSDELAVKFTNADEPAIKLTGVAFCWTDNGFGYVTDMDDVGPDGIDAEGGDFNVSDDGTFVDDISGDIDNFGSSFLLDNFSPCSFRNYAT